MNETLTLGLAQMQVINADPTANLKKAEAFIIDAKQKGVELLCFPELFTTGFNWNKNKELVKNADNVIQELAALAHKHQIWINGSVLTRTSTEKPANTSILFNDRGIELGRYSKTHLFTLMHEDQHMTPGNELCTVKTPWGLFGLAICYDLRFPELFRSYALKAVKLMLVPSAFPHPRLNHWKVLLRARAIEDQLFMVAANQVGHETFEHNVPTTYFGTSSVIDPWGETVAEGSEDKEELLVATIDLGKADAVRKKMTVLQDRRPDIYQLS